jgi:SAM-dependent methyltransferase
MSRPTPQYSHMDESTRRDRYFYAESEADLYDAAPDLNTPFYAVAHQTLQELVALYISSLSNKSGCFLDVGSGTGAETIPLLDKYSSLKAIALDICPPMHRRLEAKVIARLGLRAWNERCTAVVGDIAERPNPAANAIGDKGVLFVVSGFTLHHLDEASKLNAFRTIFELMQEGGIFVNADLYSFQSPYFAKQADDFLIKWIDRQHTDPEPHLKSQFDALGSRQEEFKKRWIDHVQKYNCPLPVESGADALAAPVGTAGEAELLLQAGFREIACPMRYWQVGVIWARK